MTPDNTYAFDVTQANLNEVKALHVVSNCLLFGILQRIAVTHSLFLCNKYQALLTSMHGYIKYNLVKWVPLSVSSVYLVSENQSRLCTDRKRVKKIET